MSSEPVFFIVASRGLTATTWFSQALNSHPAIFCCHGRDRPERGIETESLLEKNDYRRDRLVFEQRQRRMDLNEYLDVVQRAASDRERVLGNVHGFVLIELLDKMKRTPLKKDLRVAAMFRDPFPFLESYTALVCHRQKDYPEKFKAEHWPRALSNRSLLECFGIRNLDNPAIFGFTEACQALVKMTEELEGNDTPVIIMEKIVSDPAYFSKTVDYLTQGTCQFEENLLSRVLKTDKMNQHRARSSAFCASSSDPLSKNHHLWLSWPDIRKEIFLHFIRKSHLRRFREMGYDVSFL